MRVGAVAVFIAQQVAVAVAAAGVAVEAMGSSSSSSSSINTGTSTSTSTSSETGQYWEILLKGGHACANVCRKGHGDDAAIYG